MLFEWPKHRPPAAVFAGLSPNPCSLDLPCLLSGSESFRVEPRSPETIWQSSVRVGLKVRRPVAWCRSRRPKRFRQGIWGWECFWVSLFASSLREASAEKRAQTGLHKKAPMPKPSAARRAGPHTSEIPSAADFLDTWLWQSGAAAQRQNEVSMLDTDGSRNPTSGNCIRWQ